MIQSIRYLGVSFVLGSLLLASGCGGGDNSSSVASSSSSGAPAPGGSGYGGGGYGDGYGGAGGGDGYGGGGYGDSGYGDGGDAYGDESGEGDQADSDASSDASDSYGYGGSAAGGYGSQDGYQSPGYGNQSPGYGNQSPGYGNQSPGYANGYGGYPDASGASGSTGGGDGTYASGYGAGGGVDFRAQIEPILRSRCFQCHGGGPEASKGELELNTQEAIMAAGVVRPNAAEDSDLFVRITMSEDEEDKMPPKGPRLPPNEIELIRSWIQSGARFDAAPGDGYATGYGGGYDGYGGGAGGYGNPASREPQTPPPPKTLTDVASLAFRNGNDSDAIQYWFAQSLADSDEGNSVLKKYRWVSGLKQPVLAVRWGIGVQFTKQGNWEGGPKPIGVNQDIPQRGGGERGRSSGSYSSYGGGRGGGGGDVDGGFDAVEEGYADFTNEALDYYTGLLGATLIERLHMRIERSYYGDGLKEELEQALAGGGGRLDGEDEYGSDGYGSDGYGSARGGYGGYGGGYGSSQGDGGYGGGGADNDEEEPISRIEQIMPGVTMLGVGSQRELFDKAHAEGVNALVIFDVNVERNLRARLIYNTTKIRLYDVATERRLAITRGLHNVTLQKQVERDPEDDTMNLEIDKIFAAADKQFRCVEFPSQIKPEHVVRRVERLLAQSRDNPLGVLSETRFYRSRGLLTDAQLTAAYDEILPGKADELAKASDDDQIKSLLSHWLPSTEQQLGVTDEDGRGRRRREFR